VKSDFASAAGSREGVRGLRFFWKGGEEGGWVWAEWSRMLFAAKISPAGGHSRKKDGSQRVYVDQWPGRAQDGEKNAFTPSPAGTRKSSRIWKLNLLGGGSAESGKDSLTGKNPKKNSNGILNVQKGLNACGGRQGLCAAGFC